MDGEVVIHCKWGVWGEGEDHQVPVNFQVQPV